MTTEQIKELILLEAKATPAPWEFEQPICRDREQCGCQITNAEGHELFDTFNRDYRVSLIQEEIDEDTRYWWDVAGGKDLEFVAMARNNIREMAEEILDLRERHSELADATQVIRERLAQAQATIRDNEAFNQFDSMEGRALAAEARVRELEAAGKVLMEFVVDMAGYGHDDDCPLDDTCDCSQKPRNDALNAACRVVEGES